MTDAQRRAIAKYRKTDKGKAVQAKAQKKYIQSEKGKVAIARCRIKKHIKENTNEDA